MLQNRQSRESLWKIIDRDIKDAGFYKNLHNNIKFEITIADSMILIIDDDIAVSASLCLLLKNAGHETVTAESPTEAKAILATRQAELIIMDMNFSVETSGEEGIKLLQEIKSQHAPIPIILITGWGSISLAVKGMKLGAADFINKPWDNNFLLQSVKTALNLSQAQQTTNTSPDRDTLNRKYRLENIVGESPQLMSILETIGRISATDASVLIQGESGTGKELIAEAIHQNSLRKNKPFIKVNLGGISASLFESEMFGHKRGAFTDAKSDRVGRFELANKGTIFLDEIGDLDLNSQVKLLRVLQDRTFEVLGDSRSKTVDVRVICATNRNLQAMVDEGKFREDLYYRINLIAVKLPPLRERPDDIPLLVEFFIQNLRKIYQRENLTIKRKALKWIKELPLTGNIRELKNLVERTVLVTPHDQLDVDDFTIQMQAPGSNIMKAMPAVGSITLDQMEKSMIVKAMEHHKKNISKVSRSLGISRGALYRRLEKFNIPYETQD
ncbi:MAG TPA: sigma-54 dependent transcriptional regulator [Salinimicrobium sp.]|nr:sigma-54 dependent transcriptional regulator [Salinimicrobium sp.]